MENWNSSIKDEWFAIKYYQISLDDCTLSKEEHSLATEDCHIAKEDQQFAMKYYQIFTEE